MIGGEMIRFAIFLIVVLILVMLLASAGVIDLNSLSAPSPDDQLIAGERMIEDAQRYARGTATAVAAIGESRAYDLLQQSIVKTEQAGSTYATGTAVAVQKTAVVADAQATQASMQTATVQAAVHEITRAAGYLQLTREAAGIANYQTQVAIESRSTMLTLQREEATNAVMAWLPVGIKVIVFALAAGIIALMAVAVARMPRAMDKGKVYAYPHGMVDPERSTGPVISVIKGRPQIPPASTDPYQAQVTARAQAIAALGAAPQGRTPPPALFRPDAAPAQISSGNAPSSSPWRAIEERTRGKFLLGYDPNAKDPNTGRPMRIEADPNGPAPHLLMAGTTGSGKTWLGLRPLITQALGDGYQVIVLNPSAQDYDVFLDSKNARLIHPDDRPELVAEYLRRVYGEMQHREQLLKLASASTWNRMANPFPGMLVVIDEFANLSDSLRSIDPSLREELWNAAIQVANAGRKVGVTLAIALQDPSRKNIGMSLRRQFTRVAFKVQDRDASQIVLGSVGAEKLPEGHFLTIVNGLQHGIGFKPSDDDIMRYLAHHAAPKLDPPVWLDVESHTVPQHDPIEDTQPIRVWPAFVSAETINLADQIRETWAAGGSKRAMAKAAGGEYAGSFSGKIDKAIEYCEQYYTDNATTTTDDAPHMGDSVVAE
jgi:hypothetical protein